MTKTNVFTPPLDIQRSKLIELVVANSRFGSTCKSMVFMTLVRNTCSIGDEWEGNIVRVRTLMQ
jgi:hypothetical protein